MSECGIKNVLFENEATCACASVRIYFTHHIYTIQPNTLIQCPPDLGNRKLCNTFSTPFTQKIRLSQGLLLDMELLKKCFLQY